MDRFLQDIVLFYNGAVLGYTLVIMSSYILLACFSLHSLSKYLKQNSFTDYYDILPSPLAPSVSIIAPAYNEEKTIVENIRSLLSLHYVNVEVIVVNDGSSDNTLQLVKESYKMELVDFAVHMDLACKEIKGVYKSTLPAFGHLIFIDKANGGKADALNAGINVSSNDYVLCIDVDCIIEQDAILKMVKPFMNDKKQVIASGGVIRIANSCKIDSGKIVEVNVPGNFVARVQVIEYLRAFLLGRMAWSNIDGLLLISGAFGMFDKNIVIKAGGYYKETVGEDMELLVRMRRYMIDTHSSYSVAFIPDPLCWTEVPDTWELLKRQRNRWMRGTIETMVTHRAMFFNAKYKILGLLSYPYWFFFELCAPAIEFLGTILFILLALCGLIDWQFFLTLLAMVYFFALMFTFFALLAEEITFYQYKKIPQIAKLIVTAFIEPIVYHPFVVYAAITGFKDTLVGKKAWGKMERKGFNHTTKV